jgi:hypothetical protein
MPGTIVPASISISTVGYRYINYTPGLNFCVNSDSSKSIGRNRHYLTGAYSQSLRLAIRDPSHNTTINYQPRCFILSILAAILLFSKQF